MNKSKHRPQHSDPLLPLNDSEIGLGDLFLASARQDIITIEQALARQDYHSIQLTVHSLKGAAMIFRMNPTVNATQRIEAVLNTGLDVDHAQLTVACNVLRELIERS
ncbi:Hpt domain-containing protein [Collimonas arenae]|nr:Hpt domain-containing protein [Collimonas arenae]